MQVRVQVWVQAYVQVCVQVCVQVYTCLFWREGHEGINQDIHLPEFALVSFSI